MADNWMLDFVSTDVLVVQACSLSFRNEKMAEINVSIVDDVSLEHILEENLVNVDEDNRKAISRPFHYYINMHDNEARQKI